MKNLLSCIILITFSAGLSAQCLSGNCYNGTGTYLYKSGAEYTGTFKNGKPHGMCTQTSSDKNIQLVGPWSNGLRDGNFKLTVNGDTQVVVYKNDIQIFTDRKINLSE